MTIRIRVSHPFEYLGVHRSVGAVLDVDDAFGKRVIGAGLAKTATAVAITPVSLDPGLDLAVTQRANRLSLAARLALPDPRMGPVTTDVTAVALNQAVDGVTYNRGYTPAGTAPAVGTLASAVDLGEGLSAVIGIHQYGYGTLSPMPRSMRFMCDGDRFAIMLNSNPAPLGNHGFMLYIDGRPTSLTPYTPTAASGTAFHIVTLPSAKPRLIEVRSAAGIAAVYAAKPYDIWKPPARKGPRVLIMGDSWTTNANVTNTMNACYWNIGPHLNSDDVWVDGVGGSGYTVTSAPNGSDAPLNRYSDRIENKVVGAATWDISAINPELVVVHGGGANDLFKGKTVTQVVDGVVAVFSRLRERLPNARLVFVEGFAPPGFTPATYNPNYIAVRTQAQAQLTSVGVYYVDVATTRPWIRGAGTVAAVNADGENANAYIHADTFHPVDAGGLYLRNRMGAMLRKVLLDDGSQRGALLSAA